MGNKLGRRRQVVDEKYTRPQGLYQHKDVDHKKLRKLILDSKLAPCFPGDDDSANNNSDLEECPICFLYYPSLNRSRCCTKGICTECFLQMKTPNSTRPTQCPFCKTSNYAVEYRGVKTKEEKGVEQIEEQRVIEAKIRMRQQELQDEEERMLKRREMYSTTSSNGPSEIECCSTAGQSFATAIEGSDVVTSHEMCGAPAIRPSLRPRQNREDEFDLDLEDLMVMEAIWLSIQENGRQRSQGYADAASERHTTEDHGAAMTSAGESSTSPSRGLACAIAALAERQQMGGGESSSTYSGEKSTPDEYQASGRLPNRVVDQEHLDYHPPTGLSLECQMAIDSSEDREWGGDHGSVVGEAGTSYSYSHSDEMEEVSRQPLYSPEGEIENSFQHASSATPIVPESFEEQMMLAMAVSLAEARARTGPTGVAWH